MNGILRYELSQIQRGLERKVHKYKQQYLAEDAAGLDTTQTALSLKSARLSLDQFSRASGLDLGSTRTGISGFGHSAAGKASWTVRKKRKRSWQNKKDVLNYKQRYAPRSEPGKFLPV